VSNVHEENKLHFYQMITMFDLYKTNRLIGFYCASSLKQQSAGRHVAPPRKIILILILLNAACLGKKQ